MTTGARRIWNPAIGAWMASTTSWGAESRNTTTARRLCTFGPTRRAVIDGGLLGQRAVRDIGHDPAILLYAEMTVIGHATDDHGVKLPLLEYIDHLALAPGCCDYEHALLRLGEHYLVGGHAGFALRN